MNNSQKLDLILSKIDKLELRVSELRKDVNFLIDYRKRDDKIIEIEVKNSILNILQYMNQSLIFIDLTNKFPKELYNKTGQKIAELDGLILGTNDRELASKYNNKYTIRNNIGKIIDKNNKNNNIYNLYIIEGKHHIDKIKLIQKCNQLEIIQKYFKNISEDNNDILNTNKKYKNRIEKFNFKLFHENNIFLALGTPHWDQHALNYYDQKLKDNKNIFIIKVSDQRYNLYSK